MNKIKVYIGAPWNCKPQAKEARALLEKEGFEVTSSWIDITENRDKNDPANLPFFQENALRDVTDLLSAWVFLLLNIHKSEGKAVETGIALASNIPVVMVGEPSNIFHYLPIPIMSDLPSAIELIKQWRTDYERLAAEAEAAGKAAEEEKKEE